MPCMSRVFPPASPQVPSLCNDDAAALVRVIENDGAISEPSIGLGESQLSRYRGEAERVFSAHDASARRPAGIRALSAKSVVFRELIESHEFRAIAAGVLGPACFPVRTILFDKTPDANWDVPWHQDATIAVASRPDNLADAPGFGPWSIKEGVHHVQPPAGVLERMLTLRLHLDDCPEDNGALRVVPGSHAHGFIDEGAIKREECEARSRTLAVPAGGLVVMRPLTLHASRKATRPAHRRVVHVEFAVDALPYGLEWARL